MATRAEIRAKYGIVRLESPEIADKELTEDEAIRYEQSLLEMKKYTDEIDENIKLFCSKCKYYRTDEQEKCDSVRKGCSYGVDCRYIKLAKAKGKTQYMEDDTIWCYIVKDLHCNCGCNVFHHVWKEQEKKMFLVCNACKKIVAGIKDEYTEDLLKQGVWKY